MRCPRCDGDLDTLTAEGTGQSAVVCVSCGFTGISASHHPESAETESWEQALERSNGDGLPPAETGRTETVTIPGEE